MWIASLMETDDNSIVGWVANGDDLTMAVVCWRVNGEWQPLWGVRQEPPRERVPLPACFALDPDAIQTLEDVARAEGAVR